MRTKCTGKGGFSDKSTERAGIEGIRRRLHDTCRIAEYTFGAGGGFGGGALSAADRERRVGNTPRDEANQRDPHAL